MRRSRFVGRLMFVVLLPLLIGRFGYALTPEQIVIIVNGRSETSKAIAAHYIQLRNIPADHVITIDTPARETIAEADYRSEVAEPIRKALVAAKLERTTHCLVTTYDVPLRIESMPPAASDAKEIAELVQALADGKSELHAAAVQYEQMAADFPAATAPSTTRPTSEPPTQPTQPTIQSTTRPTTRSIDRNVKDVQSAAGAAVARLRALPPVDRKQYAQEFTQLYRKTHGPMALENLDLDLGDSPAAATQPATDSPITKPAGTAPLAPAAVRQLQLAATREQQGLIAYDLQMDAMLRVLRKESTHAALDNELMMLWAEPYDRAGWLPNPAWIESRLPFPQTGRPLMVSRLDGTSLQQVIAMLDTTVRVEKDGLDGVIYLDARGLTANSGYKVFDDDLRATARWLKDNTTMKVVIDDTPDLLKAENCPNAALYCGWYALKHYQDSCQWLPGAVGYHVASGEMNSLHDKAQTGWVAGLLDHGFCGTLGPVYEPYLNAFPRPSRFFPMLMSGKYTQAEVYYLTCPLTSWCIGYVGDPLYNPFKNKPRVTARQLMAIGISDGN